MTQDVGKCCWASRDAGKCCWASKGDTCGACPDEWCSFSRENCEKCNKRPVWCPQEGASVQSAALPTTTTPAPPPPVTRATEVQAATQESTVTVGLLERSMGALPGPALPLLGAVMAFLVVTVLSFAIFKIRNNFRRVSSPSKSARGGRPAKRPYEPLMEAGLGVFEDLPIEGATAPSAGAEQQQREQPQQQGEAGRERQETTAAPAAPKRPGGVLSTAVHTVPVTPGGAGEGVPRRPLVAQEDGQGGQQQQQKQQLLRMQQQPPLPPPPLPPPGAFKSAPVRRCR